jgi:RNA polymerase sigma-70 factor, ECF subfamily
MTTNKARKPASDPVEFPDFDVLLQFSLWLSKNGRSAAWSLQDIMMEGNQHCHDWMPKSNRENWLRNASAQHTTGTSRIAQDSGNVSKTSGTREDHQKAGDKPLDAQECADSPVTSTAATPEEATRAKAIAGLPSVLRSAMILSDLEGFSYREIADLAGVTPKIVARLLTHGRRLLLNGLQVGFSSNGAGSNA